MTALNGQRAAFTARRTGRAGLTLAELMVAVAILAIIIVTFSVILSQSQRVVSTQQRTMRANAAAAAIDHAVRRDIRRLTHNGFLMLVGPTDAMQCWFITAGPSRSLTGGPLGTAGLVGFGLCDNPRADNDDNDVFWRGAWVMYRERNEPANWRQRAGFADMIQGDLGDFQRLRLDGPMGLYGVIDRLESNYEVDRLAVPARTLREVNDLWMVLREDVETLNFAWTDGTRDDTDGHLLWYTPDEPKDGDQPFEDEGGGGRPYRALWTRHDLGDWPARIRMRFRLSSELLPAGLAPPTYEFILPVHRADAGLQAGGGGTP